MRSFENDEPENHRVIKSVLNRFYKSVIKTRLKHVQKLR